MKFFSLLNNIQIFEKDSSASSSLSFQLSINVKLFNLMFNLALGLNDYSVQPYWSQHLGNTLKCSCLDSHE